MTDAIDLPEPTGDELARFAVEHPADPDIEGTDGIEEGQ